MVEVRVHQDDNTSTDIISYSETFTVIPYWQSYCTHAANTTVYRSHRFTDIPSYIIQLSSQYVGQFIWVQYFDCHSIITDIPSHILYCYIVQTFLAISYRYRYSWAYPSVHRAVASYLKVVWTKACSPRKILLN